MSPHPVDFVGSVFQNGQLPRSIRLSRWWDNMRLVRWVRNGHEAVRRRLLETSIVSTTGTVRYLTAAGLQRELVFNGLNGQFCAIYDEGYRRGYELGTAVLLAALARGDVAFYDIGANWGYFSLLLAAKPDFTGPIVSFEPNPRVFADLQAIIQGAGLHDRIRSVNCGLGRSDGTLHLAECDAFNTGVARLVAERLGVAVPVRSLDALTDLPPPGLIKLDAEGMELDILSGAELIFARVRPHLCFENFLDHSQPSATVAPLLWLRDHGYRVFNPTLRYRCGDQTVLANYDDPVDPLIVQDPHPGISFVEVTPANRFLLRPHLNLFACHEQRLAPLLENAFFQLCDFSSGQSA